MKALLSFEYYKHLLKADLILLKQWIIFMLLLPVHLNMSEDTLHRAVVLDPYTDRK